MWKNKLSLSIFGQSHGPAIGMTLEGLPAGFNIDRDRLQQFLERRAPGRNPWSTPRREGDTPKFLSGLVDNRTCGAPLTAIIENDNTRPTDYKNIGAIPRPGHADYPAHVKFGGHQDVAGGGHFSGRLTAPLCIAGGIALQLLETQGISVVSHIASLGSVKDIPMDFSKQVDRTFPVYDSAAAEEMKKVVEEARKNLDSVGGTIACGVTGLPVGLGNPMFGGMENRLASMIFAIPAIKGIEFGAGFEVANMKGSENNDPYYYMNGKIEAMSNNHGGILGGLTTGMPLTFKVAVKPTSSIARPQDSVDLNTHQNTVLEVRGRHDPCIVPRAVPCVEAVAAICILDVLLEEGKYELR